MSKAGHANERLKENLIEVLVGANGSNGPPPSDQIMNTRHSQVDMDSAADKALRIIDKIIFGEKVG